MKELLRKLIPISIMDQYRMFRLSQTDKRYKNEWLTNGKKGTAPYSLKQQTIKDFAKRFQVKTFIETGTLYGDMIYYCRDTFEKLYTIELSKYYFQRAKSRFNGQPNIVVLEGDSAVVLPGLLKSISGKINCSRIPSV